jgi:hypothetical protein
MVINGWKQIGLLSLTEKDFLKQVMMENMDNTLFNTNGDALAIDFNNTHFNENVDVEVLINSVMEKSLTSVATLALGSRPRQRGCKGTGQREARESHQGLPGV